MIVTAQDIQSQQFHIRFRGFDVEEVDDFLEKIATSFQAMSEENSRLKERLESLEKDLATYQNQQKAFQNAIIAAQSIADEMKDKSKIEADEIIENAHLEARRLQEEANGEVAALEKELDRLTGLKTQMQEDLRQQLTSYLELIDSVPPAKPAESYRRAASFTETARDEIYECVPTAEKTEKPADDFSAIAAEEEEQTSSAEEQEEDFSDLYVKIDLPEESQEDINVAGKYGMREEERFSPLRDDGEEDSRAVPRLDGDMVFSLEDPLDDQDPAVSFGEDEKKDKKKTDFDPYESPL